MEERVGVYEGEVAVGPYEEPVLVHTGTPVAPVPDTVCVAGASEGSVMPAGPKPFSIQYLTCTVDMMTRSVCVFMFAKVHLVDAQPDIQDMRKSRLPLVQKHRALSQPL